MSITIIIIIIVTYSFIFLHAIINTRIRSMANKIAGMMIALFFNVMHYPYVFPSFKAYFLCCSWSNANPKNRVKKGAVALEIIFHIQFLFSKISSVIRYYNHIILCQINCYIIIIIDIKERMCIRTFPASIRCTRIDPRQVVKSHCGSASSFLKNS